jgi:hypothetical protein
VQPLEAEPSQQSVGRPERALDDVHQPIVGKHGDVGLLENDVVHEVRPAATVGVVVTGDGPDLGQVDLR